MQEDGVGVGAITKVSTIVDAMCLPSVETRIWQTTAHPIFADEILLELSYTC